MLNIFNFRANLHTKLVVIISLLFMAVWYMKSPFGSYWINAGDAWVDGAVLTSVENAKRIGWQETQFFPIRGVADTIGTVSLTPERGYAYVYTHWPSGYEWIAFALDYIGVDSLSSHRIVMLFLSTSGLILWAAVWRRYSDYKVGAYFFGIGGISYWFLSWSTTLGYWVPYVTLLSGAQLYLWFVSGRWATSRFVWSWILLLVTSLLSLQLLPWSFVVLGGLVCFHRINISWRQFSLLMTAPMLGIGSLFARIYLLSNQHGLNEISSRVAERTDWLNYLTSANYYGLLLIRIEYYLGIGITLLIIYHVVNLSATQKYTQISDFDFLWIITSLGGIVWWFLFPQQHAEHPATIVLFALAQTALWAKLLSGNLNLTLIGSKINGFVVAVFVGGLVMRVSVGYFNKIVPIPNELSKQLVSGVCATDGMMMPAIQSLVGVPCPHVGSKRFGGDNISWEIDNCDGKVKSGSFIHFDYIPRVNLPVLDDLYIMYRRWRNPGNNNMYLSSIKQDYYIAGQPNADVVWKDGPVSVYHPVNYCVSGPTDPW